MIFHVISNAIKFNTKRGSITISISYDTMSRMLKYKVTDSGIGMSEERI